MKIMPPLTIAYLADCATSAGSDAKLGELPQYIRDALLTICDPCAFTDASSRFTESESAHTRTDA